MCLYTCMHSEYVQGVTGFISFMYHVYVLALYNFLSSVTINLHRILHKKRQFCHFISNTCLSTLAQPSIIYIGYSLNVVKDIFFYHLIECLVLVNIIASFHRN